MFLFLRNWNLLIISDKRQWSSHCRNCFLWIVVSIPDSAHIPFGHSCDSSFLLITNRILAVSHILVGTDVASCVSQTGCEIHSPAQCPKHLSDSKVCSVRFLLFHCMMNDFSLRILSYNRRFILQTVKHVRVREERIKSGQKIQFRRVGWVSRSRQMPLFGCIEQL